MPERMCILTREVKEPEALIRFARAMDARDWDALLAILTPDASGELGEGPLASPGAIVGTIRRYLEPCGPTPHLRGNLLVEVDGDRAESGLPTATSSTAGTSAVSGFSASDQGASRTA